jgi:DNA-binding transcriptional ArsR family regulator
MTKVQLFHVDLQTNANIFKALANPARLAILKYLAETKVCMSGDISKELPLSRTTVNQHLKELKDIGLIQGEVEGVKVNYCINPEKIREIKGIIENFLHEIEICCINSNCK